jgi:hypothetical protein
MKTSQEVEQLLINRLEERYREGKVCEELVDFFEQKGDEGEIPLLAGSERKKIKTVAVVGSGGVARRVGASDNGNGFKSSFPPTTNRGVTIHDVASEVENTKQSCPKILGGYDGGVEVGFSGKWSKLKFFPLLEVLSAAKIAAGEIGNPKKFFILSGRVFEMKAKTAGGHVSYKYVFEGDGVKFYVHNNPQGDIQPVRIRYNAEGLIGRDLFLKHNEILSFLSEIGFSVTEEKLSRVDMQVMVHRDVSEYMRAIYAGRYVCTAQKYSINGRGSGGFPDTFTLGEAIQICIYDKRRELFDHMTSDSYKFALMIQNCFGEEWLELEIPVTRIEFRLRREALRSMCINSLSDLLEHESGLARYCCHSWFRILKEQKIKGHTHEQPIDEIWEEVQSQFQKYFPGADGHRKDVHRVKPKLQSCSADSLIKQAIGCLKSASAKEHGIEGAISETAKYALRMVERYASQLAVGALERALELEVRNGMPDPLDPVLAMKIPNRDDLSKAYFEGVNNNDE